MLVRTVCPTCSKESTVPDQYVGRNLKCPGCGETFQVRALEVDPFSLAPAADLGFPPAADPTENAFAQLDRQVNWQGYPFFHCQFRADSVAEYRAFFTPDRLVFVPYEPRPTTPATDPTRAALTGTAVGLVLAPGLLGIGIGAGVYLAAKTGATVAADKFRNQDERFREWKVEDLAAVDPKAFVILPDRTEQVSFRSTKSGWVVVEFRRDNGHEWVIRPVTDPDLKVCLECLSRFGFRVTNAIEWDPGRERYRVVEEEIDLI